MSSTLKITAYCLDVVASLIIAVTLLQVHQRMRKYKSFNADVVNAMKVECILLYFAISLLIVSFILLIISET
jgi:predicted PurR-regulated permease PerM